MQSSWTLQMTACCLPKCVGGLSPCLRLQASVKCLLSFFIKSLGAMGKGGRLHPSVQDFGTAGKEQASLSFAIHLHKRPAWRWPISSSPCNAAIYRAVISFPPLISCQYMYKYKDLKWRSSYSSMSTQSIQNEIKFRNAAVNVQLPSCCFWIIAQTLKSLHGLT